jgi:hypothetical protein
MKRYALFCGSDYYPAGGWDDFCSSYDSIALAKEGMKDFKTLKPDWWQIVDLQTGKAVEFSFHG